MNAIDLLCAEHLRLTWLLDEHFLLPPAAHAAQRATIDGFRADLAIHMALSEQLLYPVVRAWCPEVRSLLDQRGARWDVMRRLSEELGSLDPSADHFRPKALVMARQLREQIATEEALVFPQLRKHVEQGHLEEMGLHLQELRAVLAADPRPNGLGFPVAAFSAAAAQVISTARADAEQWSKHDEVLQKGG